MNNRLRVHKVLAFIALLLLMGACARESTQNQPVTTTTNAGTATAPPAREAERRDNALVRVVHAVPGAQAVDVFTDDTRTFTNVAYKTVTPYREISDDRHAFRVRPQGQDQTTAPLAENSENLGGGNHYTVVALPRDATGREATLRIFSDRLTPPTAGKAKVRVVHAAPDAGEVDVYARGREDALFGGVNVETATTYTEVDPMTVTLEVRPEGQQQAVLTVPNARFEAGKIYTIVVMGRTRGTPRLEAVIIEDQLGGAGATPGANMNANMNANGNRSVNANANRNANTKY
jgi:hypothetical protein